AKLVRAARPRGLSRKYATITTPSPRRLPIPNPTSLAWLSRLQKRSLRLYAGDGRRWLHSRLHFAARNFARRNRSSPATGRIDFAGDTRSADLFAPHRASTWRRCNRGKHRRFFHSAKTISASQH